MILNTSAQQLSWGKAPIGCLRIIAPKGYFTERFSSDTLKEEKTIDILPIPPKIIKQTAPVFIILFPKHFQ